MALCLPRKRRAASLATRPSTLSVASITNHSCTTSAGLALKVFMRVFLWARARRSRAIAQDFRDLLGATDAHRNRLLRRPLRCKCPALVLRLACQCGAIVAYSPGRTQESPRLYTGSQRLCCTQADERQVSAAESSAGNNNTLRVNPKCLRYDAAGPTWGDPP